MHHEMQQFGNIRLKSLTVTPSLRHVRLPPFRFQMRFHGFRGYSAAFADGAPLSSPMAKILPRRPADARASSSPLRLRVFAGAKKQGFAFLATCRKNVKTPLAVLPASSDDKDQDKKPKASRMNETEPSEDHCPARPAWPAGGGAAGMAEVVSFDRNELREIFDLYGRKVAGGEWRDYAIDFSPQKAVFSIYRRAAEYALYRVEKHPKLARKQGLYSVVTATGLILKRGHDLSRVIAVLDKKLKLVSG
jgi:hypothetical protein